MKFYFRVVPLLVLSALPLMGPRNLHAADSDADSLARQIETLSSQLRKLEAQVQQLEQRCSTAMPTPAVNTTPAFSVNDAWRGIAEGQTQDEVTKALGVPQQQFTLNGQLLWYYYYPSIGGGSVLFGEQGRVVGSQEPPRH